MNILNMVMSLNEYFEYVNALQMNILNIVS